MSNRNKIIKREEVTSGGIKVSLEGFEDVYRNERTASIVSCISITGRASVVQDVQRISPHEGLILVREMVGLIKDGIDREYERKLLGRRRRKIRYI